MFVSEMCICQRPNLGAITSKSEHPASALLPAAATNLAKRDKERKTEADILSIFETAQVLWSPLQSVLGHEHVQP